MVKARLLFLVTSLLGACTAHCMLKQLTKPFLTRRCAIIGRSFSVLTPEQVDCSKSRIKEIQKAAYVEEIAFRLLCSGIRLDNHTLYEIIKNNYERRNEELLKEFCGEIARLKAHRNALKTSKSV